MASSGNTTKHSASTGSSAQGSKWVRRALFPTNLPVLAAANPAPTLDMGFNFLPPFPIATLPFKFIKRIDLITMGRGLGDVPFGFGWELVEWKPSANQTGSERRVRPDEGFTEVCEVVEVEDDVSEEDSVPKIDLDLGTGSEPVLDFGDVSSESLPVFEDYRGNTVEKVGEIDIDEGLQTPSEPFSHAPTGETLTGEEMTKKRIKITAGGTDLPLVCKFLAQQAKSSSPSSHLPFSLSKPTPKPTRKSFRLAAQGLSRKTSASKQGPLVIEDIVSSPEGSPTKGSETATPKQASPIVGSE